MRKKSANEGADRHVAALAARQYGHVSTQQLVRSGLTAPGITRRVAAGRLHRIHQGVYAVGHSGRTHEGDWMAAVLALGDGTVLSHRSAAMLWRMLDPRQAPVHITVPSASPHAPGRRKRRGIRIHRSRTLTNHGFTRHLRIPVTTPARTLADLARVAPAREVDRARRQGEFLRLPLETIETDHTRSELELLLLALCRRQGIPKPEVNVRIGPFVVDFLWRQARLIVEVDGWAAHGTRSAFERDRERDAELTLLGYVVARFTHRMIVNRPAQTAQRLRRLLGV